MYSHFVKKIQESFEAIQFITNNEVGNKNMNDICIFVNQGLDIESLRHAWHNGTDIIINKTNSDYIIVKIGDWVIKDKAGIIKILNDNAFKVAFEKK